MTQPGGPRVGDPRSKSVPSFVGLVDEGVFGPKRDNGENYIMKSLVICTPYRILCGW